MNPPKRVLMLATIAFSALLFACAKQSPVEKQPVPNFNVEVPRGVKNAEPDENIGTSSDRTVSVFGGRIYVRTEIMFDANEAGDRLKEIVAKNPRQEIYLQADSRAEYLEVVILLDTIRASGGQSVALIVRSFGEGKLHKFSVQMSKLPDLDDTSIPKPNPLTLEVEVKGDGKLLLNKKEIATLQEIDTLATLLGNTIKTRTNTSEKTVSIRGTKKMAYEDMVKVIDAVKGAGASTVVLVLDDLL